MKARTLTRIDEALQRVDQGTYGTCDECGKDIAEARLSAVPFALLCLECQQREETLAAEERAMTPARSLASVA
jgi:DnaK suppressor protein